MTLYLLIIMIYQREPFLACVCFSCRCVSIEPVKLNTAGGVVVARSNNWNFPDFRGVRIATLNYKTDCSTLDGDSFQVTRTVSDVLYAVLGVVITLSSRPE